MKVTFETRVTVVFDIINTSLAGGISVNFSYQGQTTKLISAYLPDQREMIDRYLLTKEVFVDLCGIKINSIKYIWPCIYIQQG